jgi:asparaginyl-tRNA synthetase
MTSSDCEGAGEIFKITPQFFSSSSANVASSKPTETTATDAEAEKTVATAEVGLTVSSQLPLEAMAMGTGAVYTCQKSFRAEKSDTNKHLAEFLHVEYEEYFITLDDLLNQAESYIKQVIRTVVERCREQYDFLDSKLTAPPEFHGHRDYLLSLLDKPFVRIKHADAIDVMLQDLRDKVKTVNEQGKEVKLKFKNKPEHGQDLGSEHEKYLVQKFGTFVFVTHWPSAIKSFYMKQCGDGTCEAFDLLAPLVGELFGGSMREWRYAELEAVMKAKNMDFRPLQWFVDLRKDGTAPHGGWGMGFDRLVMFLTNAPSVRDVVPYPVYYGHCPY